MLFPFLYKEVEVLAPAIGDWRLTATIPAWESALFAGQPSLYLSERLAFVPLSEYLHFCYLSYVIVIPSVATYWLVSGRRAAFGELLLMLSTVLLGSYLFFILLPVDSPYYLSQRLGPPLSGHFFFDLVHQVSARGGARGGAFPSAHVSGAVVVSLVAWRHQRRLAYLLVPITVSVMIATVYGRFHYALDTLAGAALAIAVVTGYRYLVGDGPGERQSAGRSNASFGRSDAMRNGTATAGATIPVFKAFDDTGLRHRTRMAAKRKNAVCHDMGRMFAFVICFWIGFTWRSEANHGLSASESQICIRGSALRKVFGPPPTLTVVARKTSTGCAEALAVLGRQFRTIARTWRVATSTATVNVTSLLW